MRRPLLNLDPLDFDDDAPTIARDSAAGRAPVPRIDETWIDYDPLPPVGPPGARLHWSPRWRGAGVRETDDLAEAMIEYDALGEEDAA